MIFYFFVEKNSNLNSLQVLVCSFVCLLCTPRLERLDSATFTVGLVFYIIGDGGRLNWCLLYFLPDFSCLNSSIISERSAPLVRRIFVLSSFIWRFSFLFLRASSTMNTFAGRSPLGAMLLARRCLPPYSALFMKSCALF